jgi:hypothetical protein
MNAFYFKPPFRASKEREEVLLSSMLSMKVPEKNEPGEGLSLGTGRMWRRAGSGARMAGGRRRTRRSRSSLRLEPCWRRTPEAGQLPRRCDRRLRTLAAREARKADHDPIRVIADRLKERRELTGEDERRIEEAQRGRVEAAVAYASDSPLPEEDTLAEYVYADPRVKEQFARMRPGAPSRESDLIFGRGLAS